jgi:hypothetical protein
MDRLTRLGFEAWVEWMGLSPEERTKAARKLASRSGEFLNIGQRLYSPPHENVPADKRPRHRAETDRQMRALAERTGIKPKPFWTGAYPYALCLTHDIDRVLATIQRTKTQTGLFRKVRTAVHDTALAVRASRRAQNPFWNFSRLSALEAHWNIPSASYVLHEHRRFAKALRHGEWQHVIGVYDAPTIYPELLNYQARGNEIGLHASFDAWKDENTLRAERSRLVQAGFTDVLGVRSHYLHYDREISPGAAARAGFTYDSTMGFNFQLGFRTGSAFPHRLDSILEIPFQAMDSSARHQYPNFLERKIALQSIHDEVANVGGVFVLNWHTHVMNAEAFPREIELLDGIIRRARAHGAWITTPRAVAQSWQTRVARPVSNEIGAKNVAASRLSESESGVIL